jgi:hypothetical protein
MSVLMETPALSTLKAIAKTIGVHPYATLSLAPTLLELLFSPTDQNYKEIMA